MAKLVVLGGGYAGMMAASHLEQLGDEFTLVNANDYHYLTTLLHEAAGGRSGPSNYSIPISDILTKRTSHVVVDKVTNIDREKKKVTLEGGELDYDYLVVAIGWVPEFFGIPGLAEHSLGIRDLDTAAGIRSHIEAQFAEYKKSEDLRKLRIVVGGAGLTGIELMGELMEFLPKLCSQLDIDFSLVDVQCIEAMPSILPQVPESLRGVAANTLTSKGAKLRIGTKILKVEAGVVHLDGADPVEAGTIIWTGGVRANPLLSELGFTCDRRGRAKVNPFLQSVDDERIFVGGDSAWCDDEAGRPLPPTAQVASQMGALIGHNLHALARGMAAEMKPFHASLKGTLASLGRDTGVGDMGGIPVRGMVASIAKEATKVKYLWELGGLRLTADKTKQVVQM